MNKFCDFCGGNLPPAESKVKHECSAAELQDKSHKRLTKKSIRSSTNLTHGTEFRPSPIEKFFENPQTSSKKKFVSVNALAEYLEVNPKTIYGWKYRGLVPYHKAGPRMIRFDQLEKSGVISPARINRIHAVASAFYTLSIQKKHSQFNPLRSVEYRGETPKRAAMWSRDEIQFFLNWAEKSARPLFPLYQSAYESGGRISELLGLPWKKVNFETGEIEISQVLSNHAKEVLSGTKNSETHNVAMSPSLIATLQTLRTEPSGEFVFKRPDGKPWTYDQVRHRLERDIRASGMKRITFHGFRHSLVSHLHEIGVSLLEAMAQTGHRSIAAHQRYYHSNLKKKKENVTRLMYQRPIEGENVIRLHSQSPL